MCHTHLAVIVVNTRARACARPHPRAIILAFSVRDDMPTHSYTLAKSAVGGRVRVHPVAVVVSAVVVATVSDDDDDDAGAR